MSGYLEVHVPPPPDGSSGVTRYELVTQRWEIGDVFMLLMGDWVRKVRVVRVTDTGPNTREYTLRELDNGNQVFQPEADEEELDPNRLVRAYVERKKQLDAQGRHEDRQQVAGGDDGATRQQEHGPDLEGSDCEVGRAEADGEGLDGPVDEGRLRAQQAGLEQGCGSALAEGPVLGCCTPWARIEPVCVGCPIWGGPVLADFVAAAREASLRLAAALDVPLTLLDGESSAECFRRLQRERCGVSAAGVVLADDRSLGVVHVECCGGGSGGVSGSSRLPAPQDRDGVFDLRPPPWTPSPIVPVPPVGQDLLRLRDEDAPRIYHPGRWTHGCECYFCIGRIG